jgi:hypothetical protein
LFDRAVTWLLGNRVLLPGLTPLGYMVAEVRKGAQALIFRRNGDVNDCGNYRVSALSWRVSASSEGNYEVSPGLADRRDGVGWTDLT